MVDERRQMYDGFNDTGKHSAKWVQITMEFLKLAFTGSRRELSCLHGRCENRRMLSEYEMSAHLTKKGFMSNYLLWHQHGEVQPALANESDGNDDVDRMDDMVADIERGYNKESEDTPSEEQNFYSISNQCYNDIVKLIIDLIPAKHNMLKDLYQSKKIVSSLRMNYEKIDACKKNAFCFGRSTRTTSNFRVVVCPDT
jgi:hypothetical protein